MCRTGGEEMVVWASADSGCVWTMKHAGLAEGLARWGCGRSNTCGWGCLSPEGRRSSSYMWELCGVRCELLPVSIRSGLVWS